MEINNGKIITESASNIVSHGDQYAGFRERNGTSIFIPFETIVRLMDVRKVEVEMRGGDWEDYLVKMTKCG